MTTRELAVSILAELFSADDYADWDNKPCMQYEDDIAQIMELIDEFTQQMLKSLEKAGFDKEW